MAHHVFTLDFHVDQKLVVQVQKEETQGRLFFFKA